MSVEELLGICRFSKRYLGYKVFRECLYIVLEDEDALLYLTGIYITAAQRCHTAWNSVERNIRTMLKHSWETGGKETLEQLSGYTLYKKPSIGEVLEILSRYIIAHPEIK